MGLHYANTAVVALLLGLAAAAPPTLIWARKMAAPGRFSSSDRVAGRGRLSDAMSTYLAHMANVIVALVVAALVTVAFMHETLRGISPEAVWTPAALARVLTSREAGFYLVYAGVAGLLFMMGGLAAKVIEPQWGARVNPSLRWVLWKLLVRWCTRAASLAVLATVVLVPGLLDMIVAVLDVPR